MGKYSQGISKRLAHTKIKQGFCLICGNFGRLSQDHVPPKGSILITKTEQRHVTEVLGVEEHKIRGIQSSNGSKFKTICERCNNEHLGENDSEVARVCKSLTNRIRRYSISRNSPNIVVDVNAVKYSRAMIGHILSATSVEECKTESQISPYFDPLKQFVLGNDDAISDTHEIYYWFYPYDRHVSAKYVGFKNEGHTAIVSLLSFFPIAFMVTKINEGTYPFNARKLSLSDTKLELDLSPRGFEYSAFPFHELRGNQLLAMVDYQAIVSDPIEE